MSLDHRPGQGGDGFPPAHGGYPDPKRPREDAILRLQREYSEEPEFIYYAVRGTTIDGPVLLDRNKQVIVTLICQIVPMGDGTRRSPLQLQPVDFGGPVAIEP